MNIFRRLPLYRLLVLCAVVLGVGIGATALALALGSGPVPPQRSLAQAVHDALSGAQPEGFSANIQLTDHLLEGAGLASEGAGGGGEGDGELLSSPLVQGGSGRVWVARNGDFRLELQSERGDTEIVYDGRTLELYDAATNKLYRYAPAKAAAEGDEGWTPYAPLRNGASAPAGEAPSVAKIEQALSRLRQHLGVSEASATDVAGQPAYTTSFSPREAGSLLSSVQLSFDADNGVPLRAAVYSTASSSPVLELAASDVSFGPVEASVFQLSPPADAKLHEVKPATRRTRELRAPATGARSQPKLTLHGSDPGAIAVLEAKASGKSHEAQSLQGLAQVKVAGTKASELRTALGTLLTFERGGVRYLLAGSVKPAALQALASGL